MDKRQKYTKELLEMFNKINKKYDQYSLFEHLVEMMAISLSNRVDLKQYDVREKRYLDIVKQYDRPTLNVMVEIFGKLTIALTDQPCDYLGNLFMDLGFGHSGNGQYFTPFHIAKLMADINMGDKDSLEATIAKKGRVSIMEPTCGGGQLLIAAYSSFEEKGINPMETMEVYAKDISRICVLMCYTQLSLLGVPGVVVRGNGLTNEELEHWYLPYLTPHRSKHTEENGQPIEKGQSLYIEEVFTKKEYFQLELF